MNEHEEQGFLACRDCQVMEPVVLPIEDHPADALPDDVEALDAFVACHATHHTARLRRQRSETHSNLPVWDPMATIAFEVTDGQSTYVVHAERPSIDEPRVYRFAPGALEMHNAGVSLDGSDLRRGLDRHFYPHVLRASKLDRFIALVHDVVGEIAPEELDIAFDVADDPALSVSCMPEAAYQALLRRAAEIFDAWELSRLGDFLADNRNADGLLALQVRRECTILDTRPPDAPVHAG